MAIRAPDGANKSMQVFDDLRNYVKARREVNDKNHHREICPDKFHPSRPLCQ